MSNRNSSSLSLTESTTRCKPLTPLSCWLLLALSEEAITFAGARELGEDATPVNDFK
jgi:hypothetical protein